MRSPGQHAAIRASRVHAFPARSWRAVTSATINARNTGERRKSARRPSGVRKYLPRSSTARLRDTTMGTLRRARRSARWTSRLPCSAEAASACARRSLADWVYVNATTRVRRSCRERKIDDGVLRFHADDEVRISQRLEALGCVGDPLLRSQHVSLLCREATQHSHRERREALITRRRELIDGLLEVRVCVGVMAELALHQRQVHRVEAGRSRPAPDPNLVTTTISGQRVGQLTLSMSHARFELRDQRPERRISSQKRSRALADRIEATTRGVRLAERDEPEPHPHGESRSETIGPDSKEQLERALGERGTPRRLARFDHDL